MPAQHVPAQVLNTCVICFEVPSPELFSAGRCECGHEICATCLQQLVLASTSLDGLRAFANRTGGQGGVCCPVPDCDKCYPAKLLARILDHVTFDLYMNARELLTEQRCNADVNQRIDAEVQRRINDADTFQVHKATEHIVERILTLHCPRCDQAFIDFDGCCALTCSRPGCGCGFCAFCLADCGADAHRHVLQCPENTSPARGYFISSPQFNQSQCDRRLRLLREFCTQLPRGIVDRVLRECAPYLEDIGIEPEQI